MHAHDGLALRARVRRLLGDGLARQHGVSHAAGARLAVQALQPVDLRLQMRRQRGVGGGAVGEQRLAAVAATGVTA